jgi:hypothetical protein
MTITPNYYSEYTPSNRIFRDMQSKADVTDTEVEPQYCQNTPGARQATCLTDENLYIEIDGTALPYLESPKLLNVHDRLSSNIYRLKPRSTSNQIRQILQHRPCKLPVRSFPTNI